MQSHSYVMCIEGTGGMPHWLRTQMHNGKFTVIESTSYGNPKRDGYAMIFEDPEKFFAWLDTRYIVEGIDVTFIDEAEPLDEDTITAAQEYILNQLRNGKS